MSVVLTTTLQEEEQAHCGNRSTGSIRHVRRWLGGEGRN